MLSRPLRKLGRVKPARLVLLLVFLTLGIGAVIVPMQIDLTNLKPYTATRANSCWQTGELYAVGDTIYANSPDHANAGYALCATAYGKLSFRDPLPEPTKPPPTVEPPLPVPEPKPRPQPKGKAR